MIEEIVYNCLFSFKQKNNILNNQKFSFREKLYYHGFV